MVAPIRILNAEQFNELTTDQKYLYINEMLHYIVASRPRPNGGQPVGQHLERVAQPNLPDIAIEPRRYRSVVVVLVVGLFAWGILGLIAASEREHLD